MSIRHDQTYCVSFYKTFLCLALFNYFKARLCTVLAPEKGTKRR